MYIVNFILLKFLYYLDIIVKGTFEDWIDMFIMQGWLWLFHWFIKYTKDLF